MILEMIMLYCIFSILSECHVAMASWFSSFTVLEFLGLCCMLYGTTDTSFLAKREREIHSTKYCETCWLLNKMSELEYIECNM